MQGSNFRERWRAQWREQKLEERPVGLTAGQWRQLERYAALEAVLPAALVRRSVDLLLLRLQDPDDDMRRVLMGRRRSA